MLTVALVQVEVTFGLFVSDRFHYDEWHAGMLLAFLGTVMAIVQGGLIGRLTKKYREHNLIVNGVIFVALGFVALVYSHSLGLLILALVLIGFGYSLTNPCLSAWVSKSAGPSRQGSALGVFQSGASLARVLGPILAGALYDRKIVLPMVSALLFVALAALVLMGTQRFRSNPRR